MHPRPYDAGSFVALHDAISALSRSVGESLQAGGVGGEGRALFHEGADDVYTHFDGTCGAQDVCGHQGAMLGEDPGPLTQATM
jgi:hypothetical protein